MFPVYSFTRVLFTNAKRARGRGCGGHPAFPTPSQGRKIQQRLGRFASRGRSRVRNERNVIGPSSDHVRPAGAQADGASPWSAASATGAPFSAGYAPVSAARAGPLQNRPFFCCEQVGPCYKPAARGIAVGHDAILAGVAELVDALDLGSSDESCGGSSPSARTKR